MKKRILSLWLVFVLCLTLMPTAAFADDPARVDFVIQNFNSGNVHFLGDSWNEVFQFQTVNSNGTISHLPIVVRTDTDALVFDGWYTEKTGGEKVTTDTVFDSYTILYDHWVDAPETTDTVIDSIKINNSSTTNGYTILDYTNASAVPTVTKSGATLVNAVRGGRDFSIFKGVASIEPAFTDNDRMDKNADYTVVTEILLNNGYRINKDTLFSAQNGIIFRKQFFGMVNGEPVSVDNEWFAGATSVKIFISLHGEATTPYFYVQPESGSAENGTPYKYSFEITSKPETMVLQTKAGNDTWVDLCEVDYTSGVYQTPAYNDKTMTFRLVVTGWANGGPSYTGPVQSNEFTVTWGENTPPPVDPPVENRFVTQPQDATLEPEEDYNATWSLNFEPVSVKIQRNKDGEWVHYVEATATGGTISGLAGETTRTFRVVAYNDYGTAYSDEFTVTWTENTTPPAPLTELSATITAPVAGVTPVWTATAGSSDYTAEVYWWYLYGSDGTFEKLLQNTDTFESGKKYAAIVRFTPASGIEMSRDATATINGLSGKYGGFNTVTGALLYFVDFTVPEAQPAKPAGVTVQSSAAGLKISWTKDPNATATQVFRKNASGAWERVKTVVGTSWVDTDVVSGKSYSYKVRSYTKYADGTTLTSGCCSPITQTFIGRPTLSKAAVASGGVDLAWTKVSGVTGYQVYRSENGGAYTRIKTTVGAVYTDTTVKPGHTYSYKVRGYIKSDSEIVSGACSIVRTVTVPVVPTAPTGLKVQNAKGLKVTFTKAANATGTQVYRKTDGGSWTRVKTVVGSSWVDTDVVSGKDYYYKARSYITDANGKNTYSAFTPEMGLTHVAPTTLSKAAVSGGVKLSWTKVAGATGYQVFRCEGNGSYTRIKTTTLLTFTDTTCAAGKKYSYKVRAYKTVSGTNVYSICSNIVSK